MDNAVLRKRLNTFKSGKGTLKSVSDEVVLEVLRAWENWPGTTADLNRELGLSKMQMVVMLKKAKHLVKSGVLPPDDFKEVHLAPSAAASGGSVCGIELAWENGKIIRFSQVELLIDFLKKAA
jgi:hypothetical protein